MAGIAARDGTRQIWGETLVGVRDGPQSLYAVDTAPAAAEIRGPHRAAPTAIRGSVAPTPTAAFGAIRRATVLIKKGSRSRWTRTACSRNVEDAAKVAPLQPWALGVYQHASSAICATIRRS